MRPAFCENAISAATRTEPESTHAPATRRLWPYVMLFAFVVAGAGVAVAFVLASRDRKPREVPVVAVTADAAVAPDAMAVIPAPDVDAAVDLVILVDAAPRLPTRPIDASTRPTVIATPNGRGTISIQVITKPEGATLYNGTTYSGPGGTNIEQPFGARMEITCKHAGYKPGKVQLLFDGRQEIALCTLERIKVCIDGVKNPFDDCEPDPTKGSGSPIDNPLP